MTKVPPITLPSSTSGGLPQLPFSPDLLWRYPNPFLPQPPPSPLETQLKAHLPGSLGHDPRTWSREDVAVFLRFCEREFDLERIDMDKFQMNGESSSSVLVLASFILVRTQVTFFVWPTRAHSREPGAHLAFRPPASASSPAATSGEAI